MDVLISKETLERILEILVILKFYDIYGVIAGVEKSLVDEAFLSLIVLKFKEGC